MSDGLSTNPISAESTARCPRGIVKINGEPVSGWIEWEVDNNTFYSADTFRATFSLSELPGEYSAAWWASQTAITVDILGGFPLDPERFNQSELMTLVSGSVDHTDFDPGQRLMTISGRDKTALLIDTKTTEKWPNRTASEIATDLAVRHGLTPVVTATRTRTGTYYELEKVTLTDQRSEWDLLTYLANKEGFVVYVKGIELHFEAKPSAESLPYVINWEAPTADRPFPVSNVNRMTFARNLTVSKGVVVTLRSINPKTGKAYTVTYPTRTARGIAPGQSAAPAQVYSDVLAAKLPEDLLQEAQKRYAEITQHEMHVECTLPADNVLGVTSLIKVQGTGTVFDQVYYPEAIVRRMSVRGGYTMTVRAKNSSPQAQPLI